MFVFPNPYVALDALGRLAGACPIGEETRLPIALPVRAYVAAELVITEGSHVPAQHEYGLDDQADRFWRFGTVAIEVRAVGALLPFWAERVRDGEVFKVAQRTDVPLRELARARLAAIASWRAHHGADPETGTWAAQFALEPRVAEEAAQLAPKPPVEAPVAAPAAAAGPAPTPPGKPAPEPRHSPPHGPEQPSEPDQPHEPDEPGKAHAPEKPHEPNRPHEAPLVPEPPAHPTPETR